jgi:hypothetical protein
VNLRDAIARANDDDIMPVGSPPPSATIKTIVPELGCAAFVMVIVMDRLMMYLILALDFGVWIYELKRVYRLG